MPTATAQANPNIAFIKYWGNRNATLRLPANGSISMNLEGLTTRTTVEFDPGLAEDRLLLEGKLMRGRGLERVSALLDRVRSLAKMQLKALVTSENNFPIGAGIASSASAFAALSLAATRAAGLELSEKELSRLARRGSGSASRSVPGGFVEWQMGEGDEDCYAFSISPAEHWGVVDCIAVVSDQRKVTGSTEGHALASTSPLQGARLADAPRRLKLCREAILERDFPRLASVVELDSNLMHAVMITSTPPLLYWQPATLAVLMAVVKWRAEGLAVCYTVDAGPNVHVLCLENSAAEIASRLKKVPGVERVMESGAGGPACIVEASGRL